MLSGFTKQKVTNSKHPVNNIILHFCLNHIYPHTEIYIFIKSNCNFIKLMINLWKLIWFEEKMSASDTIIYNDKRITRKNIEFGEKNPTPLKIFHIICDHYGTLISVPDNT